MNNWDTTRTPLSRDEVSYWKQNLDKILKCGIEIECNLPNLPEKVCMPGYEKCICSKLFSKDTVCWKTCMNENLCFSNITDKCVNKSFTCEDEDCNNCEFFKSKCNLNCSNFTPKCSFCENMSVDCTGCQNLYIKENDPQFLLNNIRNVLAPNKSYGKMSPFGVYKVTTDNSLSGGPRERDYKGGVEVITTGRRFNYKEFYTMLDKIINVLMENKAYTDERCSIHMHVLAEHYGFYEEPKNPDSYRIKSTELERPMPEIIVANLHQLVRRYMVAMTWLISGLNATNKLTRWEKFRISILKYSPILDHMIKVRKDIRLDSGKKYGWINYNELLFNNNGDISKFQVEFRAADCLLSPSAITAIACMYISLVLKAVDLSRHGVLSLKDDWIDEILPVKNALLNNTGAYNGHRFSDTSNLHRFYNFLRRDSIELLTLLKNYLINSPAYDVLEAMAIKPISLRRIEGDSWKDIERDLNINTDDGDDEIIENMLSEIMTFNKITGCPDIKTWINTAINEIKHKTGNYNIKDQIEMCVRNYNMAGKTIWLEKIGCLSMR